jgi:hypothetical protein
MANDRVVETRKRFIRLFVEIFIWNRYDRAPVRTRAQCSLSAFASQKARSNKPFVIVPAAAHFERRLQSADRP